MDRIGRRGFLALSGAAAGSVLIGACTGGGDTSGGGAGGAGNTLRWWDQFQPIAPFERKLFADFSKSTHGVTVKYSVQNPATFPRALQLAYQSKQLPDVFTAAVNDLPIAPLVDAGWFQPLSIDQAHRNMLPAGTLIEGLNVFNGKPYSIPVFSFRSHDALVWYNKELLTKAGLNPESPPGTYDDIRAAARAIRKSGASGWIAPLNFAIRLNAQVIQMAQAAGSPVGGQGVSRGVSFRTGEYVFDSAEFMNAIEFWVAMKQDGSLFPSSTSLDARTARARWATGVAGIFMDGSYNVGVLKGSFPQFLPKVAVGPIPVPSAGTRISISGAPGDPNLSLWIAKTSPHGDIASQLISMFATERVQIGVAEAMDQPPLLSSVLDKAKVEPVYRTAVDHLSKDVFAGPLAVARTPEITKVTTMMRPVQPDLGTIVAGAVSGDIADWKGALKKYNAAMSAERDRAIKESGTKVTPADWVFSDWKPGADYVTKAK